MPKYRNASVLRRLGVRLVLFLSLALIPVGLLGVLQTQEVVDRNLVQAQARLADRTREAARAEREAVLWAIGAAHGLGQVILAMGDTGADCIAQMAEFAEERATVRTVGFVGIDGLMTCASTGQTFDFSDQPEWRALMEDPRESVMFRASGPFSPAPVIVSFVPVTENARLIGFIFVSQPHWQLDTHISGIEGAFILTFNAEGEILTGGDADAKALLPLYQNLDTLAQDRETTFSGISRSGEQKVYSVSPIVDGTVYAIGVWDKSEALPSLFGLPIPIPLFPVLMWVTSLVVAYAAVERLAMRYIRRLRSDMRRFAQNRVLPAGGSRDMAVEIEEIYDTFLASSETIIRDEAELERLIHDKNVLLKEVHHRVKNNLQLISSIMNMQLRQLGDSEARAALKQLQSRVLGLATIHRNLYKTQNLGSVQAGAVLEELVNQMTALASADRQTAVATKFDAIVLYPDQAVPLSLLTAEAVTNALKYASRPDGADPWLKVSLVDQGDGLASIIVENSLAPEAADRPQSESTGLGHNLIRAFATQLGGELSIAQTDSSYCCACQFDVKAFEADDGDAPLPETGE